MTPPCRLSCGDRARGQHLEAHGPRGSRLTGVVRHEPADVQLLHGGQVKPIERPAVSLASCSMLAEGHVEHRRAQAVEPEGLGLAKLGQLLPETPPARRSRPRNSSTQRTGRFPPTRACHAACLAGSKRLRARRGVTNRTRRATGFASRVIRISPSVSSIASARGHRCRRSRTVSVFMREE